MTQEEMLKNIVKALDSKKAEDIKVIKIGDLTILADYFVIADGTSSTQVRALTNEVEYQVKENGGPDPSQIQGNNGSNWIIIDYHDIMVHIFHKEQRDFYSLERLWSDGEEVDISEWLK